MGNGCVEIGAEVLKAAGHKRVPETQTGRFSEPAVGAGDRSDLPAEADFTEEHRVGRHGAVVHAEHRAATTARSEAGSIRRTPPVTVHEDVEVMERKIRPAFQYGEQDGEPPVVSPVATVGACPETARAASAWISTSTGRLPSMTR